MNVDHYKQAEDAGLAGPIALMGALVPHMSRDALVELEAALYDASSEEWSRWYRLSLAGTDAGERGEELRYHSARSLVLRDAAAYCSQQVQARAGVAV